VFLTDAQSEAGLKKRIFSLDELKSRKKPSNDPDFASTNSPLESSSNKDLENREIKTSRTHKSPHFAPNISLNFQNQEKYSSAMRYGSSIK
jgi:hypothetical protein